MPQPAVRVRPQRLLADDPAPGEEQPGDPRPFARVQQFGLYAPIPTRWHWAHTHPTGLHLVGTKATGSAVDRLPDGAPAEAPGPSRSTCRVSPRAQEKAVTAERAHAVLADEQAAPRRGA